MNAFEEKLAAHGQVLRRARLQTLQVNVGRKCNQACRHCHVDAGPWRTEMVGQTVARRIGEWIRQYQPEIVDITGGAPELNVQVGIDTQHLGDTVYEASLRLTVDAKIKDKVAFICDLTYAGIFTMVLPPEHLQPVLMVECPRLLFPFARSIVADATRDGGFPPVLLQPLDFVELYRQRIAAMQAEAQKNGNGTANT